MKKFAITYNDAGIENPNFCYSADDVARIWFLRHNGNTSSLDMCIQDEYGNDYNAGFDGGYFLNVCH